MAKQFMSTYVSHEIVDDDESATIDALKEVAAERLGGTDGMRIETINRMEGKMTGTFVREWEEEPPADEDAQLDPED